MIQTRSSIPGSGLDKSKIRFTIRPVEGQATGAGVTRRLLVALFFLMAIVVVGASGYHSLGAGQWTWLDCFYMTVITLSTVGFGETLGHMDHVVGARVWTMGLIIVGSGTLVYFVSNLTALVVEGDLQDVLRRRRMKSRIDSMEDHIILCGVGSTGIHIVEELAAIGMPFVAVDVDEVRLQRVREETGADFPYVVGDGSDEHTLTQAGVERAKGLVAALHEDKDNVYCTITARALNPRVRIVAKAVEPGAEAKLRRAGADSAVAPTSIGGVRMVSEMIRPQVVQFLDRMLRDKEQNLRIEEVEIPATSTLVGTTLARSPIRELGMLVIAVKTHSGHYQYNPPGDTQLEPGMTLIVIARSKDVQRMREDPKLLHGARLSSVSSSG